MVADQGAALAVGAVFLAIGVGGFIPGLTADLDHMTWIGHGAKLFGVFEVSIFHNLLHLGFGVAGLIMARTFAHARLFLIGGGLAYLTLWLDGLLDQRTSHVLAFNTADTWLHFALGIVMVVLGLTLGATKVPTGANGEILVPE